METTEKHTDLQTLCHNLLFLRKKYGYSQKTMAKLLKIGIGSLRRLERGEVPRRLGVEFLFRVQAHFKINPDTLFTYWME